MHSGERRATRRMESRIASPKLYLGGNRVTVGYRRGERVVACGEKRVAIARAVDLSVRLALQPR